MLLSFRKAIDQGPTTEVMLECAPEAFIELMLNPHSAARHEVIEKLWDYAHLPPNSRTFLLQGGGVRT